MSPLKMVNDSLGSRTFTEPQADPRVLLLNSAVTCLEMDMT